MKQLHMGWRKTFAVCTFIFCCYAANAQNNIGIGTPSPSASAKLDVNSTTQGLLMPRMTQAQRDAIATPATGLMIFQTNNTPGFYYYTGSVWQAVSSTGSSSGGVDVYGTGESSALTISSNTDWTTTPPANLNFQYSSITINSGVTLTVPSGTKLRCSGNVSISGTINVAPANNTFKATNGERGIAYSMAVFSDNTFIPQAVRAAAIPSYINIPAFGGGSGAGGVTGNNVGGGGGGSFAIYAKGTLTIAAAGIVNANGANGASLDAANNSGAGGGGGGLVVLLSKGAMSVAGTINARGGNGSDAITVSGSYRAGGGGGGGGLICLVAASAPAIAGSLNVNGGTAGTNTATGTSTGSFGGNGGASGGNGGVGGVAATTSATAGSAGVTKTIVSTNPENLY